MANERDYLSRFLTLINYPRISAGRKYRGIFLASCASDKAERKHGVDAILVFKYKNDYKLAIFECKIAKKKFDNGRFKKQLTRQRSIAKKYMGVICFEMFFHNRSLYPFEEHLSTICTLNQIDAFIKTKKGKMMDKWSINDLTDLFTWLKYENPGGYNIDKMISGILNCNVGDLINYKSFHRSLANRDDFILDSLDLSNQLLFNEGGQMTLAEYGLKYNIEAFGVIDLSMIESN